MNDWQTENDPLVLLGELYPMRTLGSTQHQTRKCRLYLLACARRHWDRLPWACRALVELAEHHTEDARAWERVRTKVAPIAEDVMHADGAPDDDYRAALDQFAGAGVLRATARPGVPDPARAADWRGLAALVYLPFVRDTPPFAWAPRDLHSADLVREIHYNPTLYPVFDPAWRTADVRAIAREMYDSRDFGAMPILADALQDAGCNDGDILGHCRDARQVHVRGCRVLDKVLDRG